MNIRKSVGLMMLAALVLPGQVMAAPVTILQAAFSGTEQVIGFETILQNQEVTNQFAAAGVVFSGGLYGDLTASNVDDFSSAGSVIAGNFINNGQQSFGQIEATFSAPVTRVGFFGVALTGMIVEAFRGATSLGVFTFPTDINPPDAFMGLQDFAGIDRIVVNSQNSAVQPYFEIDDFRFETAAAPVPEPTSMLLLGTGLAGLAVRRYRRPRA